MSQNNAYELSRVGLKLRGDYDAATAYENLDVVQYDGSCYAAKAPCTGVAPTDAQYWMLLAKGVSSSESASQVLIHTGETWKSVPNNSTTQIVSYAVPSNGVYAATMQTFFPGGKNGSYRSFLHHNDEWSASVMADPTSGSNETRHNGMTIRACTAGDTFSIHMWQNTGATRNCCADLTVVRLA